MSSENNAASSSNQQSPKYFKDGGKTKLQTIILNAVEQYETDYVNTTTVSSVAETITFGMFEFLGPIRVEKLKTWLKEPASELTLIALLKALAESSSDDLAEMCLSAPVFKATATEKSAFANIDHDTYLDCNALVHEGVKYSNHSSKIFDIKQLTGISNTALKNCSPRALLGLTIKGYSNQYESVNQQVGDIKEWLNDPNDEAKKESASRHFTKLNQQENSHAKTSSSSSSTANDASNSFFNGFLSFFDSSASDKQNQNLPSKEHSINRAEGVDDTESSKTLHKL